MRNKLLKLEAILIAIVGVAFWFQPLRDLGLIKQTGPQLDQLALGLVALPVLFALFVWINQKAIATLCSALYVGLAGYYVYTFGINYVGYGLFAICACALASLAFLFQKK